MPSLHSICASNSAVLGSLSYIPTAVFVGGTAGIGAGTAEAFAEHTKGNARIFLVGRNKAAAESIIASFPKPTSPDAEHLFVECDVTLMKNVQSTTRELIERHRVKKLNLLVMSQGFLTLSSVRTETEEGLDRKLAVHYYSRYKFIESLLPSLLKAKEEGEDSKVLTIYSAGHGRSINRNDLGLKKTYSARNVTLQGSTYNDLILAAFAARNPSLSFGHAFPGVVRGTNLGLTQDASLWVKVPMKLTMGLLSPFSVSPRDCGEYLLHGVLEIMKTPGAYMITSSGSDMGKSKFYGSEEDTKALWEHTVEATRVQA